MTQTIYKYPLEVVDEQVVTTFASAKPLCVQMQNNLPCLWALVDVTQPPGELTVRIYGTGHDVDAPYDAYLSTFQMLDGALVFHAFVL